MPLTIGQSIHHDRYRIDNLLGKGGMGAVYRAWDTSLNINVALKENLDTSSEAQKQFFREAHLLASLSHPNLPRVIDYFFLPDQGQYLVMDYVEGEDLYAMLSRSGTLPEHQVMNWVGQVCDALAYLHNQSPPIIHRDIKPANIKIRPDGRAVLVDFGIAKVYDPHLQTTTGARALTPGYSPPEQYGFGTTDSRSDIYAVGATLYHLLTGCKPPDSIQRITANTPLIPPRQFNVRISTSVEQAILKALEVGTESRFQKIDEFRAALEKEATNKTVLSPKVDSRTDPQKAALIQGKHLFQRYWLAFLGCLGVTAAIFLGSLLIYRILPATPDQIPTPSVDVGFILGTATPTNEPSLTVTPLPTAIPRDTGEVEPAPIINTALPTSTPTAEPATPPPTKEPRIFDFSVCPYQCDGKNATRSLPEKITRVEVRWQYENIPIGASVIRTWANDGNEWVRYVCNWPGPESGSISLPLYDYDNGLRSGTWTLTMIVNNQVLLMEDFIVEGTGGNWEPPEDKVRNYCFQYTPTPTASRKLTTPSPPTTTQKPTLTPTPSP